MEKPQRRRPRFRRATENLPGLEITPRDTAILRHLAAHRFLRSTHLCDLLRGSRQGVLRRLAALFHHGYVERPRAQLDGYFREAGSDPMVYALAPSGAAFLRSGGMPFGEMAWARKGSSGIGTLFLKHALLISDCTVAAELSGRLHGAKVSRPHEFDLPGEIPPRAVGSWRVEIAPATEVGVVPDAIIGVSREGSAPCLCFIEADRGTMPVRRDGLEQTSFYRKLLAYSASWKAGTHRERFGFSRFRLLTVTSSPERRDHLIEAAAGLPGARGLFLFADADELRSHGDFLSFDWHGTGGGRQQLLP